MPRSCALASRRREPGIHTTRYWPAPGNRRARTRLPAPGTRLTGWRGADVVREPPAHDGHLPGVTKASW